MDTWDDKQTGQKRTRLRVVAENMQLLGGRSSGATELLEKAGQPARRLKNRRLPNRTKTRFRFEVARASGLLGRMDRKWGCSRYFSYERDRSLHRAQHAADRWAGPIAQIAGGFSGTATDPCS
jgi:single-stranded DNA-binding protein